MKQDGKWGWSIVAALAFSCAVWNSEFRCFSVFYQPLMAEFNVEYRSVSYLIGLFEIGYGISCITVPVLFKYIDYRPVVIGAGFVSSFFIFISSFSSSLWQVQAGCGFLSGFCLSGVLLGTYTSVARYFNKYRVLAMQIGSFGASLGPLALCPLYQFFINTYGWRGAWQLVAGVYLNISVAGALLRPIELPSEDNTNENQKQLQPKKVGNESIEAEEVEATESIQFTKTDSKKYQSDKNRFVALCKKWDLDLFISIEFYLYICAWVTFATGYHNALSYLVPFGKSIGFDSVQASALVSAYATGEISSKLLHAFIFTKVPKRFHYPLTAGEIAFSTIFYFSLPFTANYSVVLVLCVLIGLCIGGAEPLYNVLLVDLFNVDKFASGFGYTNVFSHLLGMAITIFMGHIIDLTNDTASAFWIGGGGLLLASCILLLTDRRIKQKCRL